MHAFLARLGGDEYAVLLPGQSAENGLVLLDEIRAHLASRTIHATGRTEASLLREGLDDLLGKYGDQL